MPLKRSVSDLAVNHSMYGACKFGVISGKFVIKTLVETKDWCCRLWTIAFCVSSLFYEMVV